MTAGMVRIEVAYARPDKQRILSVDVPEGCSLQDAVLRSGIVNEFPEIDVSTAALGVFGKVIRDPAEHRLQDGDRIEIYRPLKIDPKQARLNRASKK
ncbi:MAG: RnfH family protein [Gammaproteobacteria bacterium]|nr:RnfH family protein [Gammaproteobacteria bacterium]